MMQKKFTILSYFKIQSMKFCVYIFLFAVVFRPAFPVLDYVLNYHYISTQLCENKNTPEMGCNGKCHLKKELAKTYKNDVPASNEKKNEITETVILFLVNIPVFSFESDQKTTLKINSAYRNLYAHLDTAFIFRPPVFSC